MAFISPDSRAADEASQLYKFELVFPFSTSCTADKADRDTGVPELRARGKLIVGHSTTFAHSTYEGNDAGARGVARSLIGKPFEWPMDAYFCAMVKKMGESRSDGNKQRENCRFDPPKSVKTPVGVIIHSGSRRLCEGAVQPSQCNQ